MRELLRLSLAAAGPAVGSVRLRRVPSAGARYPVDAHVLTSGGRFFYDPLGDDLTGRGSGPAPAGGALIVLALVPERTERKYGSRSLPSLLLDLGHALGAVAAAAAVLGVGCRVLLETDGSTLERLTGPVEGYPLAAAWVGDGPPPALAEAGRRRGAARSWSHPDLARLGPGTRDAVWEAPETAHVETETITRRRSAFPPFTGEVDPAPLLAGTRLVAALPDGLYDATGLVGRGDARPALAVWAHGQPFLADAAAVLLYTTPHAAAERTGWLAYRVACLRAGMAVHRVLLLAQARGLRARAIGSWGEADLGAALGGTPGERVIVHGAVVGPGGDGACRDGANGANGAHRDDGVGSGTDAGGPAGPGRDAK
ncbi:hypothetical protein Plo01_14700 [Planobispora longispora]|uniref:Nitroreductase domain-containing protein n=1 Tax=Planobispora longispora TaxID=28887 RepID=A0A8J3REZ9_9ACTN|nr:hypothetical protein Plo01_14700 [Planobispora longispora]